MVGRLRHLRSVASSCLVLLSTWSFWVLVRRFDFIDAKHTCTNEEGKDSLFSLSYFNRSWCPFASCFSSTMCNPCGRRFLILICTGRSASTTLTWMLDALPGVRMAGENNDTLHELKNMKEHILGNKHWIKGSGNQTAWGHNKVPPQAFSCVAQSMIETINPPKFHQSKSLKEEREADYKTIIGFKTIRFLDGSEADDKGLVDFVQDNFPCSKIIINYSSNITRQSNSAWWGERGQNISFEILTGANARLGRVGNMFGSQAYMVDSAAWLRNISVLNEMVTWLGVPERCHFQHLLAFNVLGNGYTHEKRPRPLQNGCYVSPDEEED